MHARTRSRGLRLAMAALTGIALLNAGCTGSGNSTPAARFTRTNLIASKAGYSDSAGTAANTDPNLINPWGIAFTATGPFWIADNNSGLSTVYDGTGRTLAGPFNIASPTAATGGTPDGIIANATTDFPVAGAPAKFIFSTEDGTIVAWSSGSGGTVTADRSAVGAGAVYKGLAIGSAGGNNFLFAANFRTGQVDVFDKTFAYVRSFTDTTLPAGYAPFNIANINGQLYITFAKQDAAKHDDVAGAGFGYVDIYDTSGNLVKHFLAGGALNGPWGIAVAPSFFGKFSNDLLIANFGDGKINAFDPNSGSLVGTLLDANNNPISIPGLWGISVGNGGSAGQTGTLYFTAGVNTGSGLEQGGLFGSINFLFLPDGP